MRRITHIGGVPVVRPFETHEAITVHVIHRRPFKQLACAALQKAASCIEFVRVYSQYSRIHPRRYAARIAFDIAFRGLPF